MKNIITLFLTSFILLFFSACRCPLNPGCLEIYNINLGFNTDTPLREVEIGDTITLTMEIPNLVLDSETNQIYDIENFTHSMEFFLAKMDTIDKSYVPIDSEFTLLPIENMGQIGINQLLPGQSVNGRVISFKIIPEMEGLFLAGIFFREEDLQDGQWIDLNITETCCAERVNMTHEYRTAENRNVDLVPDLKQWSFLNIDNELIETIDLDDPDFVRNGIFFFRVAE